jgi:23S rRNA (cytosine1962-C5)-methyltransferase
VATVILKKGRAAPVLRRHPWIFSGAIYDVEGTPSPGDIVDVCDAGRNWLARGYINQESQITVRLLTWNEAEGVDGGFWRRRLTRAIAARSSLADGPGTTAYRLVHAESDYLPGLIVDRYGHWLVVQFLTLGVDRRRDDIVGQLGGLLSPRGIYERSDADVREKEGLEERTGRLWGAEPPQQVEIVELGHRFLVDVRAGHKTGFYLDQRENRARLHTMVADLRPRVEVLDAFAYTGGFAVCAAAAGARKITLVDSSASALALARQNLALNAPVDRNQVENSPASGPKHGPLNAIDYVDGDVFSVLRGYRAQERQFDVIILDPPKLAHSRSEVKRASRAYKDVNLLAFQLLRPGGLLFTFSCSGRVSADLFQKIVFGALADSNRKAQITGRMTHGADHPVALSFPEGDYLKGLICRVW